MFIDKLLFVLQIKKFIIWIIQVPFNCTLMQLWELLVFIVDTSLKIILT